MIKGYLPTTFKASGAKRSRVITDIPTDGHVQSNMPSFFKGGHHINNKLNSVKKYIGMWYRN